MSRSLLMLLGFLLGSTAGLLAYFLTPDASWIDSMVVLVMQPLSQIFLRLIFAAVVPLIFSSIVLAVYEMGDLKILGRIFLKTMFFSTIACSLAVLIGVLLVSWIQPGKGFDPKVLDVAVNLPQNTQIIQNAARAKSITETLVDLIPKNPLDAAVHALDGDMLSLMVFAILFGSALLMVRGGRSGDPMIRVIETLKDISMKMVDFSMRIAPIAIAALMFSLCSRFGWSLLIGLGKYVGVVLLGLLIHQILIHGLLLGIFAKKGLWHFLIDIKEVMLAAFSTASSNVTLPISLRIADQRLHLNKKVSSFVLTFGASANQAGSALFEAVTVLFLAQVFSIHLSGTQIFTVFVMSMVAGIGTAGVPGGSLPMVVIVLQSVGIPVEGIGLILGVDRILDMSRTVLNVSGDLVAATVIDATEPTDELLER